MTSSGCGKQRPQPPTTHPHTIPSRIVRDRPISTQALRSRTSAPPSRDLTRAAGMACYTTTITMSLSTTLTPTDRFLLHCAHRNTNGPILWAQERLPDTIKFVGRGAQEQGYLWDEATHSWQPRNEERLRQVFVASMRNATISAIGRLGQRDDIESQERLQTLLEVDKMLGVGLRQDRIWRRVKAVLRQEEQ